MHCKRAKEQISLFIDRRLDPERQSKLNEHLEGCSDCSRYLDDLRSGLAMLREEAMERTSESFEWNLRRKIQRAMAQRESLSFENRNGRGDLWRFGLSAAAALLVVVTGGALWYQSHISSGGRPGSMGLATFSGDADAVRQGRPGWIQPGPTAVMPVLDRSAGGALPGTGISVHEQGRPQAASPADSITGQDQD